MKSMRISARVLAGVGLAAVLFTSSMPAQASDTAAGAFLNGAVKNGASLNGASLNGASLN